MDGFLELQAMFLSLSNQAFIMKPGQEEVHRLTVHGEKDVLHDLRAIGTGN